MYDVIGKYNKATIYARTVDGDSYAQVLRMCNVKELSGCLIRMMPDMHAAAGCTVGTSMTVGEQINPAYVGSDIGCGMQVYRLKQRDLDFAALDGVIRERIPTGGAIHPRGNPAAKKLGLEELYAYPHLRRDTVLRSLGTLGGGNHFIEVERGEEGALYLVIHSGSRRLGKDVALYHQRAAFFLAHGILPEEADRRGVRVCDVKSRLLPVNCFLSGEYKERYLHDQDLALEYAALSRRLMGQSILAALHLDAEEEFATVHNYIDTEDGILRKGAVSAKKGELLIIPINMRDGSLLCIGKGNPDWNFTAPHGAGRLMKRSEAKATFTMEEYRRQMEGVFTTSVNSSTLDESPMAYRSIEDILDTVEPTVQIVERMLPLYNFKASKTDFEEECADGED